MKKNLTFPSLTPHRRGSILPMTERRSNVRDMSEELEEVAFAMNLHSGKVITALQSFIARHQTGDDTLQRWMNSWEDKRGFDLLQCAIISNRSMVVTYLLQQTDLFDPTHFPKLNPYAHLAATLGFKESLTAVLEFRPEDFFAASLPRHAVKLPHDVITRLKLGNMTGMTNRKLDKIVRAVKGEMHHARFASQAAREKLDNDFEELVREFEESLTDTKMKPSKVRTGQPGKAKSSVAKFTPMQTSKDIENDRLKPNHLHLPFPRKKRIENKVTVFSDAFNDSGLGKTDDETTSVDPIQTSSAAKSKNERKTRDLAHRVAFSSALQRGQGTHQHPGASRIKVQTHSHSVLSAALDKPEIGVPKFKKYKEFVPHLKAKAIRLEDHRNFMDKTPLTLAAEKNHLDCVIFLLQRFHSPKVALRESENQQALTMAVRARSTEALAILLQTNVSKVDYQSAVLLSIRQFYPDSLSILLTLGEKHRRSAFYGESLFHILYTQSLQGNDRYEMLPEMTKALINSGENVNFQKTPRNYPLYTLIQSAFNVSVGKHSLYFLKCFTMLLHARANPNFHEKVQTPHYTGRDVHLQNTNQLLQRPPFSSAIHCIFECASAAIEQTGVKYWSQIFMQKFIEIIESEDQTPRQTQGDLLFVYMSCIGKLGLNRRVLRALLRYGADPDKSINGKYAINAFFEKILPFMARYKISNTVHLAGDTAVNNLLFLGKAMSQACLRQSVLHFLDHHFLSTPLQALELTRKFCYYANQMITSPRSLSHLASLKVWVCCSRNADNVRYLGLQQDVVHLILP